MLPSWSALLVAASLIAGVASVTITLYNSNDCASSNTLYCGGIGTGLCCYTTKFYFYSISYDGMPDTKSAYGQTYLAKRSPSGTSNECGNVIYRSNNYQNPCYDCYSPDGSTCNSLGGGKWFYNTLKRDYEEPEEECSPVEASMMQLDNHHFRVLGDDVPEEVTEGFFRLFHNETIHYADIPKFLLKYEEPEEAEET